MATWNLQQTQCHLLVCNGGSCTMRQADEVTLAIRDEIAKLGLDRRIHTTRTRCNGRCADACVVIAYPQGLWYKDITPDEGRLLVRKSDLRRSVGRQSRIRVRASICADRPLREGNR